MSGRSVQYQLTTQKEREEIFLRARKDFPNGTNPYPIGGWRHKEYNDGENFEEGYQDYPAFKCVYKKSTKQYISYLAGWTRKKIFG